MELHVIEREGRETVVLLDNEMRIVKPVYDYLKFQRQKDKETIDKVSKAIDKLKRKNKPINFETVSKEAGVSRATLYNNAQVKERILSLRAISKASPLDDVIAVKKDKIQLKDEKIATLRKQVKKLEDDKKKLIVQLVDYEELKSENERLKKQLAKR